MAWLLVVILALVVVAMYPVVRDFLRKRRVTVPAYVEGLQAALDGRTGEAIVKLKDAVAADTGNVDAYIRLGDLYMQKGEAERAIKIHENLALRRNMDKRDERKVLLALVRDYMGADRKVKAASLLEELVASDKDDAASMEKLAELHIETGSWDKCESLLAELAKNQANRQRAARLYTEFGRACSKTNPAAALASFNTALKLDPSSVRARLYLGDHQVAQSDTPAAIKTWNELLDSAPKQNALVRERLERAYFDTGRFEDIVRLYEKLLRKVPDDAGLAVALAGIYQKKEDLGSAIRQLEKFADRKGDVRARVALAGLYLDRGDAALARSTLNEVLDSLRSEATADSQPTA